MRGNHLAQLSPYFLLTLAFPCSHFPLLYDWFLLSALFGHLKLSPIAVAAVATQEIITQERKRFAENLNHFSENRR